MKVKPENPTEDADQVNAQLPMSLQFPSEAPEVYWNLADIKPKTPCPLEDISYPGPLDLVWIVRRCSRAKYPDLADAQRFFNTLRRQEHWIAELPIFRTALWWVKRITTKDLLKK